MCGFVGYYDRKNKFDVDLKKTLSKLHHRGPDDQKILEIGNELAFGFCRLAIIDLSESGAQPMSNETGELIVVFNGEIYNYKELRSQLALTGHKFISQSDTEVLIHMYEEYGIGMLQKLEGMFAIALYDQKNAELYLIRDRMGIKPLYYSDKEELISFSSEIKAIFDMPNVSKNISTQRVAEFLQYEYIHAPNTLFNDIKKIMPGHYLKITYSDIEDVEYWDCRDQGIISDTIENAKKEIIKKLKESLMLHLRSDVPVGMFLSGGIDSGLLVALASEQLPEINTYTLKFNGNNFDESHLAQMVADKYKTNHHCYSVSALDMEELLPEMIWFCDEPLGDSGILPNYIINRLVAKDGIKVVLSGAGGDELFAGYNYYFGSRKERMMSFFSTPSLIASMITSKIRPDISCKIQNAILLKQDPGKHMIASEKIFDERTINCLVKGESEFIEVKEKYYSNFLQDELNRMLYTDMKTYLVDDLLLLADRTTMANSIEGRVPFLYTPLIEYAMSLPQDIKAPGKQRKWLLRYIAEDYLPRELINAPKMGFCSPVVNWGTGEFGKYVYKILNSERSVSRKYWNDKTYKKYVSDVNNYKNNFSKIYLLLILELYMRVHVDNNFSSKQEINLRNIYAEQ